MKIYFNVSIDINQLLQLLGNNILLSLNKNIFF